MSSTCSVVNCVFVVVILPPSDTAVPSIVIEELASLSFAIPPASLPSLIDPANMAFVIPPAFTCNESESISIELSSTPTARVPLENERPSPATEEDNAISFAFAVIPSPPITLTVTSPEVPPPVIPVPATTEEISPASFVKLITPVELLYDKSPPADIKPLTCDVDTARSIAPSFASSYVAVRPVCVPLVAI